MSYLRPLKPRHIGIIGAGVLLTSAVALWLASMQRVDKIGGFKPFQTGDGGAGYALEHWIEPPKYRWLYLAGMAACLGATATLTIVRSGEGERTLLNIETLSEDIPDTIEVLTAHFNQFAATGLQTTFSWVLLTGKKTGRVLYLRTAPAPMQDAIAQLEADRGWFRKFLKARHNWVTGRTGAGKTYLVLALIVDWLEANPDGIITICDLAYGKPDEKGFVNDWLGLPVEYIRMEVDEIAAAVQAERAEMEERRKEAQTAAKAGKRRIKRRENRLIVIDEWDTTVEEHGGKDGDFYADVRSILKFGGGYGHKCLLSGQTIATGETAISEATRNQMAIAILGTNATKTDEVGKLKSESAPLIERAKDIRRKGRRAAIVQLGDADPVTVIVPALEHILNQRIVVETNDPDRAWWHEVFTVEVQQDLHRQAGQYARGEVASPLKAIAQRLGCRVRSDDARYTRFLKPAWEAALEQVNSDNHTEEITV